MGGKLGGAKIRLGQGAEGVRGQRVWGGVGGLALWSSCTTCHCDHHAQHAIG